MKEVYIEAREYDGSFSCQHEGCSSKCATFLISASFTFQKQMWEFQLGACKGHVETVTDALRVKVEEERNRLRKQHKEEQKRKREMRKFIKRRNAKT